MTCQLKKKGKSRVKGAHAGRAGGRERLVSGHQWFPGPREDGPEMWSRYTGSRGLVLLNVPSPLRAPTPGLRAALWSEFPRGPTACWACVVQSPASCSSGHSSATFSKACRGEGATAQDWVLVPGAGMKVTHAIRRLCCKNPPKKDPPWDFSYPAEYVMYWVTLEGQSWKQQSWQNPKEQCGCEVNTPIPNSQQIATCVKVSTLLGHGNRGSFITALVQP